MVKTPLSVLLQQKGSYIYSVQPSTSIADCIEKMNREKIGALVILENDKLVGMFTERDILKKVVGNCLDLKNMPVSDMMTRDVKTVLPEMSVEQAMKMITEYRFRHLPVVKDNKLLGVLSIGDITRYIVSGQEFEIEELKKYINDSQHPSLY